MHLCVRFQRNQLFSGSMYLIKCCKTRTLKVNCTIYSTIQILFCYYFIVSLLVQYIFHKNLLFIIVQEKYVHIRKRTQFNLDFLM